MTCSSFLFHSIYFILEAISVFTQQTFQKFEEGNKSKNLFLTV